MESRKKTNEEGSVYERLFKEAEKKRVR